MSYKFANFWDVAISQAITAGATTIYVDSDDAALLPSLGVGDEIRCVLYTDEDTREIISITAVSGGTLTVSRAKESTTAQAWPAGTRLVATVTGEQLQIVNSTAPHFVAASASAAGNDYTVTVVGTIPSLTDSEELSFTIPTTNTGNPVRVKVTNGTNDTGWVTVLFLGGTAPEAGDFESGFKVTLRYFGSNYYVSAPASYQGVFRQMNQGPLGNPNMERNSRLEAWNAATSFSSPASLGGVCDGWYVQHDGTIGTYTVSRQTFTLGQTDVPFDPKYFLRWDHSSAGSGSTLRSLRTKIPGVHTRAGEKIIRRVYAKADVARNVEAKIIQHFGTGGSPSADVEAATETWALTTSWQAFDIEATLASISGKTLGSGGDDGIVLALNLPVNTTMTIDFAMPSTEPGKISTYHNGSLPLAPQYGGLGGSFDNVTNLLTLRGLSSIDTLTTINALTSAMWVCQGRLTLSAGVPVTVSDVTGATIIYFTPYVGNLIAIYNGTKFVPIAFTELSQATTDNTKSPAAVANNSNYDLFVWLDGSTLRLSRGPAWTSDTGRGTGAGTTELELVQGVYLNKVAITNGPAANRGTYVGTVRSNGSAAIADSFAHRMCWNMYNRIARPMKVTESTDSWTYSTVAFRQMNNNAANQLTFVRGLNEDCVQASVAMRCLNNTSFNYVGAGIGLDRSNANDATLFQRSYVSDSILGVPSASYVGCPGVGYHYLAALELGSGTNTQTWIGDSGNIYDQSGIMGQVFA